MISFTRFHIIPRYRGDCLVNLLTWRQYAFMPQVLPRWLGMCTVLVCILRKRGRNIYEWYRDNNWRSCKFRHQKMSSRIPINWVGGKVGGYFICTRYNMNTLLCLLSTWLWSNVGVPNDMHMGKICSFVWHLFEDDSLASLCNKQLTFYLLQHYISRNEDRVGAIMSLAGAINSRLRDFAPYLMMSSFSPVWNFHTMQQLLNHPLVHCQSYLLPVTPA